MTTPARLATIRRDLAHLLPEQRGPYVGTLMWSGEWTDSEVQRAVYERPDARAIIAAARAFEEGNGRDA